MTGSYETQLKGHTMKVYKIIIWTAVGLLFTSIWSKALSLVDQHVQEAIEGTSLLLFIIGFVLCAIALTDDGGEE